MTESGDRTAFLATLANRLAGERHENLAHPAPRSRSDVPLPRHVHLDPSDLSGSFAAAASRVDATVHVIDEAAIGEVLARVVDHHAVRRAVVTPEPEVEAAAALLAETGVEVRPYSVEAGATADLGLTSAVAGVAATGSLVLDAGAAGGRGASLLPRVHVCVLPADRLVATTADVLRPLGGHAERLPSNLVLVTGPSRTGDIEQILTLGVHGPVAVEILLLSV